MFNDLARWAFNADLPLDTVVQRKRARALMSMERRNTGWDDWPDTRPHVALAALDSRGACYPTAAVALDYRDTLGAQHAAVATLTGSASAARVASPPDGVAPLLTAGRSVRGPGLPG